jgi:hypothetical protein
MSESQDQMSEDVVSATAAALDAPRRQPAKVISPAVWHKLDASQAASLTGVASTRGKAVESLPWQNQRKKPAESVVCGVPRQEKGATIQQLAEVILHEQPADVTPASTVGAGSRWQSASAGEGRVSAQVLRRRQAQPGAGKAPVVVAEVAPASGVREIGEGARHLLRGTVEILHGTLSSVTTTGRYALLGVRFGIEDSASLVCNTFARICQPVRGKS